ncbi:MAG: acyl carrier protein [Candidatus Borkfalkiaceae bacterium]|nr:acyl carrier protein [Christensenellaceae bacterium]
MDNNTFEKVAALIADQLGIDKAAVTPEKEVVKDFGADSLDIVEMLMGLEEEYGITISEEDAGSVKTVGDIVALIEKHAK